MSIYDYRPEDLSWDEVDPARHPFDPADAMRVIAAVPRDLGDEDGPEKWSESLTLALAARSGRWTYGWCWGKDESDVGGGPVGAWCCLAHSVTKPRRTIVRAHNALCEWRAWIEHLTALFGTLAMPAGPPAERLAAWERAVTVLVNEVVVRTEAGDAWYRHCAQVLRWFLAHQGVPEKRRSALVDQAIGGRFESWISPRPELVGDVARQVAGGVDA